MSGNLISNVELCRMVEQNLIGISPFEEGRAQLAHYPLDPEIFYRRNGDVWSAVHSFADSQAPFILDEGEYIQVEIRQYIVLGEGIVGQFVASSNLINQGISLTAGKVTFPFGQENERIYFGLRNNLPNPVKIVPGDLVAYVQFFDLIGSERKPYALSQRDKTIFEKRRKIADDDGVWALQEDSPV